MNYQGYVIAAYAAFVIVLGWDFVAARLQLRRELTAVRRRAARQAAAATSTHTPNELTR
ncbi:MAG: heme exporter protein CcmD [Lysobacter sp.]|nr:heme exporter protein CcmD [Lysobacter sp.]MDQ3269637.1 heme exporter protein CcmD [Pseudomonadota bacterium]